MADVFSVDAAAAANTATVVAQIRTDLGSLDDFAGQAGVTGSARVQRALEGFVENSSDARKKLDSELERAAGLLSGLATGATTLDTSLADAVTPESPVQTAVPVGPQVAS